MIDYGLLLKDVRRDVLAWPGGRSIREDYEPDAFAPSTLAVVAEWLAGVPRAQELIALAETAQWSRAAADELIDLIDDWRQANTVATGEWHDAKAHAAGAEAVLEEVQRAKAAHDKERNQKAAAAALGNQRAAVMAALQAGRPPEGLPPLQGSVLEAEFARGKKFDPDNAAEVQACMRFIVEEKHMSMARSDNVRVAIRKLRAKGL